MISAGAHAVVITAAVAATLVPRSHRRDDADVPMVKLAMFRPPAASARSADASDAARPIVPKGFQLIAAPREIPRTIDAAALPATELKAEDFSGRGVLGGFADGIAATRLVATGPGIGDAIDADLADQQPYLLPGQLGPAYPEELRDDAPDGIVVARFVIDTLGRAEGPSFHVLESSGPLFAESVRTALDRMRYAPARFSGRRVRVRVEQRFEFHLASR